MKIHPKPSISSRHEISVVLGKSCTIKYRTCVTLAMFFILCSFGFDVSFQSLSCGMGCGRREEFIGNCYVFVDSFVAFREAIFLAYTLIINWLSSNDKRRPWWLFASFNIALKSKTFQPSMFAYFSIAFSPLRLRLRYVLAEKIDFSLDEPFFCFFSVDGKARTNEDDGTGASSTSNAMRGGFLFVLRSHLIEFIKFHPRSIYLPNGGRKTN